MATNAEIARDARRGQFALVGGFCGIVLFGSLFSQTQRALLDAVLAPPAAFAAVAAPPVSHILAEDTRDVFPRPLGFAPHRIRFTNHPLPLGRQLAQNFTTGVPQAFVPLPDPAITPGDTSDVQTSSGAGSGTGDAPGSGGGSGASGSGGGSGSPVSFAPPSLGGGSATLPDSATSGTTPGIGTGTTPGDGTAPGTGTNPGTGGTTPGAGTGTTPGTGDGTTPGTGTIPGTGTTPGTGGGTNPSTGTLPGTGPGTGNGGGTTTGTSNPTDDVSAVPEPTTWAMLISGFFLIGWAVRRQRAALAGAATIS